MADGINMYFIVFIVAGTAYHVTEMQKMPIIAIK